MRELFTNNNNINRDGILLLDENLSGGGGVKSSNENNLVLFEGSGTDEDSLALGNFVAIRDEVDQKNKNGPIGATTIIEDSLTKSFKHKEYSIFKSMSLTSAINPGHNNSSSPYHNNNNYYYSNVHNYRNQFQQQRQLQPLTAPVSLFNNNNNNYTTNRSFNQNYMYYQNNILKNTTYNNKRHTKTMPLNQTQQNKNKSSTNISSTSSLSSSSASSLKSTSHNLQKSSSSSPFRHFNSFHNTTNANTRHFSMSPIQKQQATQPTAKDFSLGQEQFDLIKSFFDKLQQYSYLKVKLVKQHMLASIVNNEERRKTHTFTPQINEDDVTRTLNLIDFDKDGLFNFENFCDYLNLFLANRENLKEKLKTVIKAKRIFLESSTKSKTQHATSFLSKEEIKQIVTFLDIFYNNNNHSSEKDAEFFSFDIIDQPNDLDEFICLLSKRIEEHLFLQTP